MASTCGDFRFGPVVATLDCRGGFDFTVTFEASILNILPTVCLLFLAAWRLFHLSKLSSKVFPSAFRVVILVSEVEY